MPSSVRVAARFLASEIKDPPDAVAEEYSYGKCIWLALALHDRYRWPLYAQIEREPSIGEYVSHAYVKHPSGTEIDILGPQDQVDSFSTIVRRLSRQDFIDFVESTNKGEDVETEYRHERAEANRMIDLYIEPKLEARGLV